MRANFNIQNSLFIILFISISCAAQKNNKSYYHEDLHFLRPKFEYVPDTTHQTQLYKKGTLVAMRNVNVIVDEVLDSINRFNVTRKLIDGYTIQVYSGQNREEAMNAKKKMNEVSDLNAELEYNQPKFRVRTGSYYSRLEAQKDLLRLKRPFPTPFLCLIK